MGFRDMSHDFECVSAPYTILLFLVLRLEGQGSSTSVPNLPLARSPGTNTVKTLLGTRLALTLPTTNLKQHRTKR